MRRHQHPQRRSITARSWSSRPAISAASTACTATPPRARRRPAGRAKSSASRTVRAPNAPAAAAVEVEGPDGLAVQPQRHGQHGAGAVAGRGGLELRPPPVVLPQPQDDHGVGAERVQAGSLPDPVLDGVDPGRQGPRRRDDVRRPRCTATPAASTAASTLSASRASSWSVVTSTSPVSRFSMWIVVTGTPSVEWRTWVRARRLWPSELGPHAETPGGGLGAARGLATAVPRCGLVRVPSTDGVRKTGPPRQSEGAARARRTASSTSVPGDLDELDVLVLAEAGEPGQRLDARRPRTGSSRCRSPARPPSARRGRRAGARPAAARPRAPARSAPRRPPARRRSRRARRPGRRTTCLAWA